MGICAGGSGWNFRKNKARPSGQTSANGFSREQDPRGADVPLRVGECQHVLSFTSTAKESRTLERGQQRVTGVGVERPEPARLLPGQPKSRHLQKLPSDNLEQPDEVETW